MSDEVTRDQLMIQGLESVLGGQFPPSLKFETIGQSHTLTITSAEAAQDRDFDSGALLSWPSGDPKMILVLIGVDDEGHKSSFWVRGVRATGAFRAASLAADMRGVAKGDVWTITRTQDVEIPPERKGGKSVFANGWEMSVTPAGAGGK